MPQSTNFTFRRELRQSQRTSDSKQGSETMKQGYNESVFFFLVNYSSDIIEILLH